MTARGAIFFDLDGTLFDTRADRAATVNHTRRDLGLADLPADEVIVHVAPRPTMSQTHLCCRVSRRASR